MPENSSAPTRTMLARDLTVDETYTVPGLGTFTVLEPDRRGVRMQWVGDPDNIDHVHPTSEWSVTI